MLQRPPQQLGEFLELPGLHQFQMIGHDLPGHAALARCGFRSAAAGIREHPWRPRPPDPATARSAGLPALLRCVCCAGIGDLFERGREVAVLVQVADDVVGGVAHVFRHHQHAQLRVQMIGQRDRRGKKSFKRRLFDRFGRRALIAGIQIIVEEGAEIDLVERVFLGFLLGDLALGCRRSRGGFGAVSSETGAGPSIIEPGGSFRYRPRQRSGSRPQRRSRFRESSGRRARKSARLRESPALLPASALRRRRRDSSRTGFSAISCVIMSFSSSRFSWRTVTIWTSPGVRICFCETFSCSLGESIDICSHHNIRKWRRYHSQRRYGDATARKRHQSAARLTLPDAA